jgi:AcrR family transcriptional regulator
MSATRRATAASSPQERASGPGKPAGRRRGQALEQAIFEAALAELAETGYLGLSLERVAQRARTGNASLYRRWPTRAELVIDAAAHRLPELARLPDTGDVREDLLELLRWTCRRQAGPAGEIMRGVIAESIVNDRVRAARARLADLRTGQVLQLLRRGQARGQVRPGAATATMAAVAPALVFNHFLLRGTPMPDDELTEIIDQVIMPLIRPASG